MTSRNARWLQQHHRGEQAAMQIFALSFFLERHPRGAKLRRRLKTRASIAAIRSRSQSTTSTAVRRDDARFRVTQRRANATDEDFGDEEEASFAGFQSASDGSKLFGVEMATDDDENLPNSDDDDERVATAYGGANEDLPKYSRQRLSELRVS